MAIDDLIEARLAGEPVAVDTFIQLMEEGIYIPEHSMQREEEEAWQKQ